MRKVVILGTLILVLVVMNSLIFHKEQTLMKGQTMLLKLAPVDPRSLMQGDYMILRYSLERDISSKELDIKGNIVVTLDANKVASFVRVHNNEQLKSNEYLLFYRNANGLRLGAESFFFQEGHADIYENARYGELKVDASGASVLLGLRGEDFATLGPQQKNKTE